MNTKVLVATCLFLPLLVSNAQAAFTSINSDELNINPFFYSRSSLMYDDTSNLDWYRATGSIDYIKNEFLAPNDGFRFATKNEVISMVNGFDFSPSLVTTSSSRNSASISAAKNFINTFGYSFSRHNTGYLEDWVSVSVMTMYSTGVDTYGYFDTSYVEGDQVWIEGGVWTSQSINNALYRFHTPYNNIMPDFFQYHTGAFVVRDHDYLAVSEVPVPAAVWLMGSGLLGLCGLSRKKKA